MNRMFLLGTLAVTVALLASSVWPSAALAEVPRPERLGKPKLKVALILSPSEEVPIAAQLDLFEQLSADLVDPRKLAVRLRHIEESNVAYLELFTNPFGGADAANPEREKLIEQATELLATWYAGLQALERTVRQLRDHDPTPLRPHLVRNLFDGNAVAAALADREAQDDDADEEDEDADEEDE